MYLMYLILAVRLKFPATPSALPCHKSYPTLYTSLHALLSSLYRLIGLMTINKIIALSIYFIFLYPTWLTHSHAGGSAHMRLGRGCSKAYISQLEQSRIFLFFICTPSPDEITMYKMEHLGWSLRYSAAPSLHSLFTSSALPNMTSLGLSAKMHS